MDDIVSRSIQASLSNFCYENAIFLAERYVSHTRRSEHSLNLLATCYTHASKYSMAYELLKNSSLPQNRYLCAYNAYKLGKLAEAESILKPRNQLLTEVPNGEYGLYLLGLVSIQLDLRSQAIECFKKALEINPLLWSAYEALCNIGVRIDAQEFFGSDENVNKEVVNKSSTEKTPSKGRITRSSQAKPKSINLETPKSNNSVTTPYLAKKLITSNITPMPTKLFNTPSVSSTNNETPYITPSLNAPKQAPPVQKKRPQTKQDSETSRTLFKDSTPKRSTRKSTTQRKTTTTTTTTTTNNVSKNNEDPGFKEIIQFLNILKHIGNGYLHLQQLECKAALESFKKLHPEQYNTGWVLTQVGKCYYEMIDYNTAKSIFEEIRKLEPKRTTGMEIYSTILWHNKQLIDLSFLANSLVDSDPLSPEVWCVVGNCCSLQKNHESAIKFFERAIQLDNRFVYAYTLIGHEYMAQEKWEKATLYFRNAISLDPRHYNAWYGLGMIHFHQGRYDYAEYHFRKASSIHPKSSILNCQIGIVLHSRNDPNEALKYLNKSIQLDPTNTLAKFRKAYVLYTLGDIENALEQLEELKIQIPNDSLVYYMLGKMYKMLDMTDKAMDNLSQALELDPKNPDLIKKSLENLKNNVVDDEDDTEEAILLEFL